MIQWWKGQRPRLSISLRYPEAWVIAALLIVAYCRAGLVLAASY